MNLYRVMLDGLVCYMVVATSEKQAAGMAADDLNWRWRQTDIDYQITDFDVKKIDIDSFRQPTIID